MVDVLDDLRCVCGIHNLSSATLHDLILVTVEFLLAQVGQWLPRPSWNCVACGVTGDEMMIIHC